ncbi:MAG: efflux transporter outer membrane subunit [Verrucomicrobiales bacterium]|jgi:multidrug efflux system outer membrane protein|nr:efflux transporter outer membrane subunit [Verrucomicrobiales bacterium]
MKQLLSRVWLLLPLLVIGGCAVGPDYQRPVVDTPPDWRWKKAEPGDDQVKGPWWKIYSDGQLDKLEEQALANNQNLKASLARLDQARAISRSSESDFFPKVNFDPSWQRTRTSAHNPIPFPGTIPSMTYNSFSVPFDLSYEVDLWGRVRRSFESAEAQTQASAADYQNTMLSVSADVANTYFALREIDGEIAVLNKTLAIRNEAVELQEKRFKVGLISEVDLSRARNEKATTVADLASTRATRAKLETSLALLCGQVASQFQMTENPLAGLPPDIPVGLPSTLLERRPDIATAERKLASRNAEIGVAYAAFFPAVSLTGQAGYLSAETSDLFNWPQHVWSFGPTVTLPIFSGGENTAKLKAARAAYDEAVADYRQQVLVAFQDVEESLSQIRFYREQAAATNDSVVETDKIAALTEQKYKTGTVDYFEVINAQRDSLQSQRDAVRIQGLQYSASVRLIKSLGGTWN